MNAQPRHQDPKDVSFPAKSKASRRLFEQADDKSEVSSKNNNEKMKDFFIFYFFSKSLNSPLFLNLSLDLSLDLSWSLCN